MLVLTGKTIEKIPSHKEVVVKVHEGRGNRGRRGNRIPTEIPVCLGKSQPTIPIQPKAIGLPFPFPPDLFLSAEGDVFPLNIL